MHACVGYPYCASAPNMEEEGERQKTKRRFLKILATKYCIGSVSSLGKSRFMAGLKAYYKG